MSFIKYDIKPHNKKEIKDFLFNNYTDKKQCFFTNGQAKEYVDDYLKRIPEQISGVLFNIFADNGWRVIITDDNLGEKFGYNHEIYSVTDKEHKTIYVYAYSLAIEYRLGHELGHLVDIYLGNISESNEWDKCFHQHKQISNILYFYFTVGYGEISKEEYFADSFLLYLNDAELLQQCNVAVYNMFVKFFKNIYVLIEAVESETADSNYRKTSTIY